MRNKLALIFSIFLISLMLACSSGNVDSKNKLTPTPTSIPTQMERLEPTPGVLRVGIVGSFPYSDLHEVISEWATLYGPGPSHSRLMKFIPNMDTALYMTVACDLCSSYEKTNSTTYDFLLNPTSRFQESQGFKSRPVTSGDVIFSLRRIGRPESPHNILTESIESMESLSSSKIRLKLKYPDPDFLLKLASPHAVIVAPEQFSGDVSPGITGSGPWLFSQGQSGQITLSSWPEHSRGTNSLSIEFRIAANQEMILRMLKNGSVDIARIPNANWPELEADGYNSSIVHRQGRGVIFGLNSNKPPFHHLGNRKAIFAALNPNQALKNSFGIGEISTGLPLADQEWELTSDTMTRFFNKDGVDLKNINEPFELLVANFGESYRRHGEIIASQLKGKGANIEVTSITRPEYLKRVWIEKDFDAFLGPLPPTNLPNNFASSFVHSGGEMNVTGGLPALDELVEKFAKESNEGERATIALSLQEELLSQALFFMAASSSERWVFTDSVENFIPLMPMGSGDLWSYVKKN